jgi:hypothetical protein
MVVPDTDHMSLLEWSGAQGSAILRSRLATFQQVEVATPIIAVKLFHSLCSVLPFRDVYKLRFAGHALIAHDEEQVAPWRRYHR